MSIILEHLTKRYEGYAAVNNVSLEISEGEFFVLLGSSGSGKTTVLNMVGGLVDPDGGRILLHNRDVTHLPPQQRKVGYVFQHYALFQHMSIAENVEFGLSIRKVPKAERRRRGEELLDLVGLAGLGNRMPNQLSGGQQQRVALARALAHQPDVLLLDEPLGALDAKIRQELRRALRGIQKQLGIAAILVTHDQEEAFDLADRLGVMSYGRLLEIGTPQELYQHPKTEFVATFLGAANLLVGRAEEECIQLGPISIPNTHKSEPDGSRVQMLFRPEDVELAPDAGSLGSTALGQGIVEEISFGGASERLRLSLPPIPGVRAIAPAIPFGSHSILVDAVRLPDEAASYPLPCGAKTWVGIRRFHTLTHPGMQFLVVADNSLRSQAAIQLTGSIARLAHGRVTLLGIGKHETEIESCLQEARKLLGSGLASLQTISSRERLDRAIAAASENNSYDLIVLGIHPFEEKEKLEAILQIGDSHLLLVSAPHTVPVRALVCVAGGEPGKEDIHFAGRLLRHLGADITLLTVLPTSPATIPVRSRVEKFQAAGVQTLSLMGLNVQTKIRSGEVVSEVLAEARTGDYDLLVFGAPMANQEGEVNLAGPLEHFIQQYNNLPILIVRSKLAIEDQFRFHAVGLAPISQEKRS